MIMMAGELLCHLLLVAAASHLALQVDAQLMNRDEMYILVAEDQGLTSATQVASLTLPSATMCALRCMERGDQCDAFQYNAQQQQCQLHHQLSSPSAARTKMQGYRLFRSPKVVSNILVKVQVFCAMCELCWCSFFQFMRNAPEVILWSDWQKAKNSMFTKLIRMMMMMMIMIARRN